MAATPLLAAEPLTDSQRHVERAGSVLQYAIPAAGLLATWVLEPQAGAAPAPGEPPPGLLSMGGTPRHDLALAVGRTWLVTEALKQTVDETRPNGGSHSFPSGHTSLSFAGAEFIRKEYGWGWAAPAYLAAGFVGWSRVDAKKHYTHDVLAGATIGVLANHDFWRWNGRTASFSLSPGVVHTGHGGVPGLHFELEY